MQNLLTKPLLRIDLPTGLRTKLSAHRTRNTILFLFLVGAFGGWPFVLLFWWVLGPDKVAEAGNAHPYLIHEADVHAIITPEGAKQ